MGSNGELRASDIVWKQTAVNIPEDVLAYGDAWKDAYKNLGAVVPVKPHHEIKRDGLFHVIFETVSDIGIKYDDVTGFSVVEQRTIVSTDRSFNPYLIFWLVSVIAMAIYLRLVREGLVSVAASASRRRRRRLRSPRRRYSQRQRTRRYFCHSIPCVHGNKSCCVSGELISIEVFLPHTSHSYGKCGAFFLSNGSFPPI